MRHVRRVKPLHVSATQGDLLSITDGACLVVCNVIYGDERRDLAAKRQGRGRIGEELIERTAFVRLEMREGNVAKPLNWHHVVDRLAHQRKEFPRPGVEQQRIVIVDQVLAETEPAGQLVDCGADAIDSVCRASAVSGTSRPSRERHCIGLSVAL